MPEIDEIIKDTILIIHTEFHNEGLSSHVIGDSLINRLLAFRHNCKIRIVYRRDDAYTKYN